MNNVFITLIKNDLKPDTYYVLHCINENIIPNEYVNASIEKIRLIKNGWLSEDLKITLKSIPLLTEINSFFKKNKQKTSSDVMGLLFEEKIITFLEIFPNKKLSSGKYARVNSKNLEAPFKWFFENYSYSWEEIIKATEKYVDEFSIRNYQFMRNSQYFIRKQNIDKSYESDLATYCELIKTNPDNENINYFTERIV